MCDGRVVVCFGDYAEEEMGWGMGSSVFLLVGRGGREGNGYFEVTFRGEKGNRDRILEKRLKLTVSFRYIDYTCTFESYFSS